MTVSFRHALVGVVAPPDGDVTLHAKATEAAGLDIVAVPSFNRSAASAWLALGATHRLRVATCSEHLDADFEPAAHSSRLVAAPGRPDVDLVDSRDEWVVWSDGATGESFVGDRLECLAWLLERMSSGEQLWVDPRAETAHFGRTVRIIGRALADAKADRPFVDPAAPLWTSDTMSVGDVHDLGTWTPDEREIVTFAMQWDPLPFHVDVEQAAESEFGALAACGTHIMAILQRLHAEAYMRRIAVIAGRGLSDVKLLKPVLAGMELRASVEITNITRRPSGRDIVEMVQRITHDGTDVLIARGEIIVRAGRPGEMVTAEEDAP